MANHIPQRMCVACRSMHDKDKLIRIVVENEDLVIDTSQKKLMRGFYLCKNTDCINLAQKKKVFQRALKKNVSDEFLKELINYAE